jgi:peptidoglycan/xylan/chitin deacetylase (PgdA/CDA1 family)
MAQSSVINSVYYRLKPLIPRPVQIWLRRKMALRKRGTCSHIWPILEEAGGKPDGWSGWPDQRQFALVLTHDVETDRGQQRCERLMSLEQQVGFRSSFNFVPERYDVSPKVRDILTAGGFEVGVHGLNHDGRLYQSKRVFQERAHRINGYLEEWGAVGFRSPAAHHNLEWLHDLNIEYDASTFDSDPFEPQPDGMQTIFPFWVAGNSTQRDYVELPYTLPQDLTLFVLLGERTTSLWKQKLDWIAEKGGMALMITHPDYMAFDESAPRVDEYPATYYAEFLAYVRDNYKDRYWQALPKEIAAFLRSQRPGVEGVQRT